MISIVFSAATCEAFIAELAESAGSVLNDYGGKIAPEPSAVATFKDMHDEVEKSKGSLNLKYILGYELLSGQPINKGTPPYQDFALLLDLRNSLVHVKLDRFVFDNTNTVMIMKYPPIVEKLRPKGILAPLPAPNTLRSWVSVVSTPALSQWCVRSAAAMIVCMINVIPAGRLKSVMDFHCVEKFSQLTAA